MECQLGAADGREAALGRPAWEVLAELVVEGKRTPAWSERLKALF